MTDTDVAENMRKMEAANVQFPFGKCAQRRLYANELTLHCCPLFMFFKCASPFSHMELNMLTRYSSSNGQKERHA